MSSKLDYLRRYLGGDAGGDGAGDGEKKKKRKRKKERDGAPPGGGLDGAAPRAKKLGTGITVHDDDVDDWKYAAEREAERRAREEEGPVVVGGDDPGVSKGRARQYLGIREDGSGWAVADGGGDLARRRGDDDLSPPRPGRTTATTTSLRRGRGDTTATTKKPISLRRGRGRTRQRRRPPRRRGRGDTTATTKKPISLRRGVACTTATTRRPATSPCPAAAARNACRSLPAAASCEVAVE